MGEILTVEVMINGESRRLENLDESWVNRQVNLSRRGGLPLSIEIVIKAPGVDLSLFTPKRPGPRGSGGGVSREQEEVIEAWRDLIADPGFPGGRLIAFLKHLKQFI